jgi:outer membrane receptor protein involved in Fe transport
MFLAVPLISAETPPANAIPAADDAEVITLEEFTVSTASSRGSYITTESASGTRTKEAVVELPYSLQIMTEDFMNDFGLFDRGDSNAYVAGATFGTGSETALLGEISTLNGFSYGAGRDGFRISLPSNPANTIGSEVISGAQGTFYGEVAFGGVINYKNRRPYVKPRYMLTLNAGNNDYYHASAFASGPLVPNKLYYLLTLDHKHERFNGPWSDKDSSSAGLSLLWKISRATALTVGYEYSFVDQEEFRASANLIRLNGGSVVGVERYWTGTAGFNQYGPDTLDTRKQGGLNVLLEHRISSTWAARGSLQTWFSKNAIERDNRTTIFVEDDTGRRFFGTTSSASRGTSPFKDDGSDSNIGGQFDITGVFRTGSIPHKAILGLDYARRSIKVRNAYMPTAWIDRLPDEWIWLDYDNPVWLSHTHGTIDPTQPGTWNVVDYDLVNRYAARRDYDYESFAAVGSLRSHLFKDYLITNISGRIQADHAWAWSQPDEDTTPVLNSDGSWTYPKQARTEGSLRNHPFNYGLGLNSKILGDNLVLYAVASTAFTTNRTGTIDKVTGALIEPDRAVSLELGGKGFLLQGRLAYTVSAYQINRENVSDVNPAYDSADLENSPPQYITGREDRTRGIKTYFVWVPLRDRSLNVTADIAYTDGIIVKDAPGNIAGKNPDGTTFNFDGWRRRGVSKWKASLASSYLFKSGPLKNLKLGASLAFRSNFLGIEPTYTTSTSAYSVSYPAKWFPSLTTVNAFVNYTFATKSFVAATHKLQLNAQNLTNEKYYSHAGRLSFGTTFNLSYTLNF